MLPSVAVPAVPRFGRGVYSFRPGEALADFRVRMDVREAGRRPDDRFEIDHQAYRLEQSRCFQASGGALSCLTCHDPHRKVPAAERAAHYRKACLGCHAGDLAGHPAQPAGVATSDCVGCHMPRRRTEDVVHTVMTDHRIERPPADPDALLAPRAERDPDLSEILVVDSKGAPAGEEAAVYRALAALRSLVAPAGAVAYLEKHLAAVAADAVDPWITLAQGELHLERWKAAEAILRGAPGAVLEDPAAREQLALALAGEGSTAAAEAVLRALVQDHPNRPDPSAALGRMLLGAGRPEAALPFLASATELGPNRAIAWDALGVAELGLERQEEALDAFRRALEVDPTRTATYLRLADALLAAGRREEALRYLRVGAIGAAEPDRVVERLERLEAEAPAPRSRGSRR